MQQAEKPTGLVAPLMESITCQPSTHPGGVDQVDSWSRAHPTQTGSRQGIKVALVSPVRNKLSPTFVFTPLDKTSTESIDNSPYFRVCLLQTHKTPTWNVFPPVVRVHFMKAMTKNLQTFLRRLSSVYRTCQLQRIESLKNAQSTTFSSNWLSGEMEQKTWTFNTSPSKQRPQKS